MEYIFYALGILTGVIIMLVVYRFVRPLDVGYLRVDHSDPDDGPYMFLELTEDLQTLSEQKTVRLRVKLEDYISRE